MLADGVDPASDLLLAARATQLTDPSTQHAIANALTNVLDAAQESQHTRTRTGASPPVQYAAVQAARQDLLELIVALREQRIVSAQAAALAALLVWDSASPMYTRQAETSVRRWARATIADLQPTHAADKTIRLAR